MKRGNTPTVTIKLPEEFAVSELEDAVFSIAQQNTEIIRKKLNEMTTDEENNTLHLALTQKETLLLRYGDLIEMQLRIKIKGKVIGTNVVKKMVEKTINEEIL
ncbi:MAG: hypothetical protein IJD10_07045 [Clostridia bacterium]|nr:hypothetical protein [Clostridia bacterium]